MSTRVPRPTLALLSAVPLVILATALLHGCQTPGQSAPTESWRPAPLPLPQPVRGVWVARFHYRYADDIPTIMANCARLGCNTVYWQVRGEGTVAYPSAVEPWSREFGFADPGFDPLAIAVQEAHRRGLRIEAWLNVMPGWKGRQPPPAGLRPPHVYHAHPDWFLHDAAGRPQPPGDFYAVLNPCRPEVRGHILRVVDELLARYDLDGIHLDYVRYAWDESPGAKQNYPRDLRTLALYSRDTGRQPDADPAAWDAWRANQLTRLVAEIRSAVQRRRPGAALTAAVWRDPRRGYRDYLQNAVAWVRAGLVEAVLPMAYAAEERAFAADIEAYRELAPRQRIIPGLGAFMHEQEAHLRAQLRHCRAWGGDLALFSYESFFPTAGDRGARPAELAERNRGRQMRREVLSELFPVAAGTTR